MKKLVVIGGGFAGARIAKALEKDFDLTLIDGKEFFEYTPGILRTIVEPGHIKKVQVLHRHYLHEAKVIVDCVKRISCEEIILKDGKEVKYDYLVICSGSWYAAPIKEMNVVFANRAHELRDYYEEVCKAKDIVVIGGGLVGVELAAEFYDKYEDKKVTLIHSHDKLISRNHQKAIKFADRYLRKCKVKILYNQRVVHCGKKVCETDKGEKLRADLIFSCTGIKPNFDFMKKNFSRSLSKRGFIEVNDYLQIKGCKNIFAAGDIVDIKEEKTAQNAQKHANIVIKNVRALRDKKDLVRYESMRRPMVISLGKWNGIFQYKDFVLTGFIPAILKWYVERKTMWKYL